MKRLLPLVLAGAMMLTTGATALADNVSDALEKAATMTNDELYAKAQEEMVALRVTAEGDAGASLLPLRDILRDVLDNDPASLVLAHNHPSGNPQPSQTDKRATQTLCAMLRPLGVNIADHIILAGDDRISFRDLGLL